ncbi:MAG: translation initiation factor IF-2 N-terminal domain-containing protein, partial [Actinomycetota bacterium]|nr:translation initiation factor IF-2 N-terminal domain-containing protein [Actinomycetota bacterium]
MAKKRVHELAKQYDMPSQEVMRRLNAAGIAVKAAASAVDEDAADRALTGKPQLPAATNGAATKAAAVPVIKPGQPIGPLGRGPLPPPKPAPKPAAKAPAKPADDGPRRPTRSSLQGERAPGSQGGVRRVVIDSQASRRPSGPGGGPGGGGPGGPGGPGGGPPQR